MGRCLVIGAAPLHDVVGDLVRDLGGRGWQVDTDLFAPLTPGRSPLRTRVEAALASELRCLRDLARVARRAIRELQAAPEASAWFTHLDRTLVSRRYDVVVMVADLAPLGAVRLATRQKVPVVVVSLVALAQELRQRRWLPLLRAAARLASRHPLHADVCRPIAPAQIETAVFASAHWRSEAVAAGIAPDAAVVIPFGVPIETADLPPRQQLSTPVRLLWAGRLSPEKGLHHFLGALPLIARRTPVRLTAIAAPGPDAYARQIERLLRQHDLHDRVTIRPAVPRAVLDGEFARRDVLLFHSVFAEPVAQVLLHAAAAGLPIVGPASTRAGSLLRDGETAWCYPTPSPRAIADAVIRAIDAPFERRRRARQLHSEVRAAHNWSTTVTAYDGLLARRAGGRRTAPPADGAIAWRRG